MNDQAQAQQPAQQPQQQVAAAAAAAAIGAAQAGAAAAGGGPPPPPPGGPPGGGGGPPPPNPPQNGLVMVNALPVVNDPAQVRNFREAIRKSIVDSNYELFINLLGSVPPQQVTALTLSGIFDAPVASNIPFRMGNYMEFTCNRGPTGRTLASAARLTHFHTVLPNAPFRFFTGFIRHLVQMYPTLGIRAGKTAMAIAALRAVVGENMLTTLLNCKMLDGNINEGYYVVIGLGASNNYFLPNELTEEQAAHLPLTSTNLVDVGPAVIAPVSVGDLANHPDALEVRDFAKAIRDMKGSETNAIRHAILRFYSEVWFTLIIRFWVLRI